MMIESQIAKDFSETGWKFESSETSCKNCPIRAFCWSIQPEEFESCENSYARWVKSLIQRV